MWLRTVSEDTMRSFLLLATVAFVAVQFTQVFGRESYSGRTLEETPEEIAELAQENGTSEIVIEHRLTVLNKIKQLPFWENYNVIEQERFRVAVIKNIPIPDGSEDLMFYEDFTYPENADLFQGNIGGAIRHLLANIPVTPLPTEKTAQLAMASPMWNTLDDNKKDRIMRCILRDQVVPDELYPSFEALWTPVAPAA